MYDVATTLLGMETMRMARTNGFIGYKRLVNVSSSITLNPGAWLELALLIKGGY